MMITSMNGKEVGISFEDLSESSQVKLKGVLANSTYELFPSKYLSTDFSFLSPGSRISVSCASRYGIKGTVDLAEIATKQGFIAVPHIPARMISSKQEANDLGKRLIDGSMQDIFIVGGNNDQPNGPYTKAYELIREFLDLGYNFKRVGLAGYPDGHFTLDIGDPLKDLFQKYYLLEGNGIEPYLIAQMSFSPRRIVEGWIERLRLAGIDSQINLGLPGVLPAARLAKFLGEYGIIGADSYVKVLDETTKYYPNQLLIDIFSQLEDTDNNKVGLHISTFNQLAETFSHIQEL